MTAVLRRRYVDVWFGQVHLAEAGDPDDRPVVLLHQTPRSWDEFVEVLAVLGRDRWAIAVDLPGMGASDPASARPSIEDLAAGVLGALDSADIDRFDLVGHHTGGVVAVEIAAAAPERVRRLVLSSTPYVDAAARERRRQRPAIDEVEIAADGSHLTELWQRRQAFYPAHRPDLLTRFVRDALRVADPEAGHAAVSAYRMEERLGAIRAPTLIVAHAADPYSSGDTESLAGARGSAEIAVIDGGMVPLEYTADEFASIVGAFLSQPADEARASDSPHDGSPT